jgi:hypothetical protein
MKNLPSWFFVSRSRDATKATHATDTARQFMESSTEKMLTADAIAMRNRLHRRRTVDLLYAFDGGGQRDGDCGASLLRASRLDRTELGESAHHTILFFGKPLPERSALRPGARQR